MAPMCTSGAATAAVRRDGGYLPTAAQNGAVYQLEPQCAPGKRLDVSSSQDVNGANVQIWTGNDSTAQQWRFESQGDGLFELIPLVCHVTPIGT
jgi:hypothetical protein